MAIYNEFHKLNQESFIDLYELDLNNIGVSQVYRFDSDKEVDGSSVSYKGQVYTSLPIEVKGFELTSKAPFPKPIMKVSNVMGTLTAIMLIYQDFVGAKLTRHRTLVRHLDGHAEAGGDETTPEVYFIERPIEENEIFCSFELANGLEMGNLTLPRRYITRRCGWRYRSPECGYTGSAMFTIYDQPTTDPTQDKCSHTVNGCKLHFGNYAELPYGGFPSVDVV